MIRGLVLDLDAIDVTEVELAGGKGANLGELSRIDGTNVPAGFCVTTDAFRRFLAGAPALDAQLDRLSGLQATDREAIRELTAEIREVLEGTAVPDAVVAAVTRSVVSLGEAAAYAVRSSATAEDLPGASFAGQQDSYLNVVGSTAVLRHVRLCWASQFTERAVTYRLRNRFDLHGVQTAVLVQHMVLSHSAGVLFTADPVTSNRKLAHIEAGFGLGEALVSGRVPTDVYKVRDRDVVAKTIATKKLAVQASPGGGTREVAVEPGRQAQPVLTDLQILELAQLGRRIEAHFGRPQDIEWCLADGEFRIVQSRPITTLYPIPERADAEPHVYISVGHQQMMTDAMKPLGLSLWQLTTTRPMFEAGARLFVDVTPELSSAASRAAFLQLVGRSDPLIGDALQSIVDRGDFIPLNPHANPVAAPRRAGSAAAPIDTDPAIVTDLIERRRASIFKLKDEIRTHTGTALVDFILADLQELQRLLFEPPSSQVIRAGMEATWSLTDLLRTWLGEKNAVDPLTQSVPNNVTSEMGLALLDVADVIRPHPEVVSFLQHLEADDFLDELPSLEGGPAAREAMQAYLDNYGMRCVGEIDVTRPRWSERPAALVPMLLSNIRNFAPGAGARRVEQGRRESARWEQELLERLRRLPDGEGKAAEAKRMIDRVRIFSGYREYPKYHMVSRYFVYKQALLEEAERLVQARVLGAKEDIYYLRLEELHDVVRTQRANAQLISERKDAFRSYVGLRPPRVLTSEGEVLSGIYRSDAHPAGALVGLPVSAGTVEGRARIILDMAGADLEQGDVLVTAYTDPSWTPAFVAINGLVTEVGGLMTHGAVIAREYGLPAVVGVENATRLIRDGQRIRVDGTSGFVEVLG